MKTIGLITNTNPLLLDKDYDRSTSHAEVIDIAMGGNTGNIGFIHGTKKLLGDRVLPIGWGENPASIHKHIDHIVVCCANQIGKHVDLGKWADMIEVYDKPVTLIGLGAQASSKNQLPEIPEGTRRFLSAVSQRRISQHCNILVRGSYTQSVLEQEGYESVPTGCPSLLISDIPSLGKAIVNYSQSNPPCRIAVAAGNPWHTASARLENTLIDIVNHWKGEYIVQHPLVMLQYSMGEAHYVDRSTNERFCKAYSDSLGPSEIKRWFIQNSIYFTDAHSWIRYLRKFDITIGPRYHGVALAIQAGRPSLAITIDSRTQELCESTGVKHIPLSESIKMSANELIEASAWNHSDGELFDKARILQSERFSTAFQGNMLSPSAHALGLTGWKCTG